MTVQFNAAEGTVVEFADRSRFQLGIVDHVDEKTGKIRLLIQNGGRELNVSAKQILFVLPARISTHYVPSNIASELRSIETRACALVPSCDIGELWSVVDDGAEISLSDLAGLRFGQCGAVEILAMIRALRADHIYFKMTRPGLYLRRSGESVETLRHQEAVRAQKAQWRGLFVDEAAKVLDVDPETRESILENVVLPHSDVCDAWRMIEEYALFGAEARDRAEAEILFGMLQDRLNRGFAGTAHFRARAFLREAGYWKKGTSVPMLKFHIPAEFSEDIEREAHAVYQKKLPEKRRDLTHLNVVSIDDGDTLDIDDALSLEFLDGGMCRLGVHIASPASAIPFGTPLEIEARRRASSVYLPEKRVPMLPLILSENGLSLMPGEKRAAVTFFMTFDDDFNLVSSEIVPSVVESKHRLTYDAAEQILEEGNDGLADELRKIQELCEFSAAGRRNHGAVDVDLPEYKLAYDEDADMYQLIPIDGRMMSRQLVSECMILANHRAAEFCAERDIPALYRVQPSPVGMPHQKTLDGMPNDYMRAYAIRRCMQPAVTSLQPGLHAGLGVDHYLQATSPLRRYSDMLCHYQIEHWFAANEPLLDAGAFNACLSETDLGLSNARSASHEAYQTATLRYLSQLGDAPLEAVVVQYQNDRGDLAQVNLVETQMRANVPTRMRLPLGTICHVAVEQVHPENGTLMLRFIDVCDRQA